MDETNKMLMSPFLASSCDCRHARFCTRRRENNLEGALAAPCSDCGGAKTMFGLPLGTGGLGGGWATALTDARPAAEVLAGGQGMGMEGFTDGPGD